MFDALRKHWPEYLMEAAGLGLFMLSAGVVGTLVEWPQSPVRLAVADALTRRAIMGAAMGLTAVGIIYCPWGKRSGAHINPAFTLTFWRLGKVAGWDALFYAVAQFAGGIAGTLLVAAVLGEWFVRPPVSAVATTPGPQGWAVAFVAEVGISFLLMLMVLVFSNPPGLASYTGLAVGLLLAVYVTFEAPFSGMSLNPARTFASAVVGWNWTGIWIYFVAPPLGMLAAAEGYVRFRGAAAVRCVKLHHDDRYRCIFCESRTAVASSFGERGA